MSLGSDKQPKRALGRGLGALLPHAGAVTQRMSPAASSAPRDDAPSSRSGVVKLSVDSIKRDNGQPRKIFDPDKLKELSASIKQKGVLQPVLVRKDGNVYRIIAGERRWRASQLAGLKEIPALVRDATELEAFELAIIENVQRADLNPIEEAEAYRRLVEDHGLTQEQVSERVGKERSTVTNALRLLSLPPEVKEMVAEGSINMGHARALLGIPRIPEMKQLAERIANEKLSVRDVERLAKETKGGPASGSSGGSASAKAPAKPNPSIRNVVEELQRTLGTKVRINDRNGKGKGTLEIDFFSYADLDRLLAVMRKK